MKCKLCGKMIEAGKKHCPACARAARLVKKIPRRQRLTLRKIVRENRIAIRRLLA